LLAASFAISDVLKLIDTGVWKTLHFSNKLFFTELINQIADYKRIEKAIRFLEIKLKKAFSYQFLMKGSCNMYNKEEQEQPITR